MLKNLLVIHIIIMISLLFGSQSDEIWSQRQTPAGAANAYAYFKDITAKEPSFENYWKLANTAYTYAEHFKPTTVDQKELLINGREAAIKAIELNNKSAVGYFMFAINSGSLAKLSSEPEKNIYTKDFFDAINKVIEIEPTFGSIFNMPGAAYMVRARIYAMSPSSNTGVDNKKLAEDDYKKALELGASNRRAHLFYAEFLLSHNRKLEAKTIIEQGLAIKSESDLTPADQADISLLNKLKQELQ